MTKSKKKKQQQGGQHRLEKKWLLCNVFCSILCNMLPPIVEILKNQGIDLPNIEQVTVMNTGEACIPLNQLIATNITLY